MNKTGGWTRTRQDQVERTADELVDECLADDLFSPKHWWWWFGLILLASRSSPLHISIGSKCKAIEGILFSPKGLLLQRGRNVGIGYSSVGSRTFDSYPPPRVTLGYDMSNSFRCIGGYRRAGHQKPHCEVSRGKDWDKLEDNEKQQGEMDEYIRSWSGVYYLRLCETCHRRTKSRSLKNSRDNPRVAREEVLCEQSYVFLCLYWERREVIIASQVSLPPLENESIHSTGDEAPRYARQAQTMIPVINTDAKEGIER